MKYFFKNFISKYFDHKNQNPTKDNFTLNREGYVIRDDKYKFNFFEKNIIENLSNNKISINFLNNLTFNHLDFLENKFGYTPYISKFEICNYFKNSEGLVMIMNIFNNEDSIKLDNKKEIKINKNKLLFFDCNSFNSFKSEKKYFALLFSVNKNDKKYILNTNDEIYFSKNFYQRFFS